MEPMASSSENRTHTKAQQGASYDTQVLFDTPCSQVVGHVTQQASTPRPYQVEVPSGQVHDVMLSRDPMN